MKHKKLPKMPVLGFALPQELIDDLDVLATKYERKRGDLVRRLLREIVSMKIEDKNGNVKKAK